MLEFVAQRGSRSYILDIDPQSNTYISYCLKRVRHLLTSGYQCNEECGREHKGLWNAAYANISQLAYCLFVTHGTQSHGAVSESCRLQIKLFDRKISQQQVFTFQWILLCSLTRVILDCFNGINTTKGD